MRRLRFSRSAEEDLRHILDVSLERWGETGRRGYTETLAAGFELIAAEPNGIATHTRDQIRPGLRSLHLGAVVRAARRTAHPVHVIFFRTSGQTIEIVRILHERMDPDVHLPSTNS